MQKKQKSPAPKEEKAKAKTDNPKHKEDFDRLLSNAVKGGK